MATLLALGAAVPATVQAEGDEAARVFRVRLSRDYRGAGDDDRDVLAAFQVYCDHVCEAVSLRWKPVRSEVGWAPSLEKLIQEFESGTTNSAYLSAYEYVRLREQVDVVPLMTAVRSSGRSEHQGLLVVRAEDRARSILDLRGKRFVYLNRMSTYGYLFPQWLLCRSGEPNLETFFGQTIRVRKEKSAITAVRLGEADVASVSDYLLETLFELRPALRGKLRVLARSEPLPLMVLVVSKEIEPKLRDIVCECVGGNEVLLGQHQESLRYIRVTRMVRTDDREFDRVRALMRTIEASQKPHVCPVCGKRLGEQDVGASLGEDAALVRFCTSACRDVYSKQCERARAGAEDPLVVLALPPELTLRHDPRDVRALYELILADAVKLQGIECAIQFLPDLGIVEQRLRAGTLSVVQLTGPAFVRLAKECDLEPLFRSEGHAGSFRAVVIVSRGAGIRRVEDLRDRALAISTREDSAPSLHLRTLLRPLGAASAGEFFRSVLSCPSDEAAIRAVSLGEVDAALVRNDSLETLRERKPGLCRSLSILSTSEDFHDGPICSRRDLPVEVREILVRTAVRLHETEPGRALLALDRSRRFVRASVEDYDSIRALLKSAGD